MAAKLRVTLTENLGFFPPVLGYLATVSDFTDGYLRYRVRHPGGIFSLQLNSFTSALLDLATTVKSQENAEPLADNITLPEKWSATLFSFTNYYNAAYDIILGCCKPGDSPPTKEVWKWLKAHGYTAENAYRSALSEANFFLDIFNELKHTSKRFGTVAVTRSDNRTRVLGYYLESVDESGAIVPDPAYHKGTNNEYAANSFNYDLRRLYYLLYKIGDSLQLALQQHFNEFYSVNLPFDSVIQRDATALESLFQTMQTLSLVSLPNEVRRSVPVSRTTGRNQHRYLVFENYKAEYINESNVVYEVNTLLPTADGFSRKWGLPYVKKRGT